MQRRYNIRFNATSVKDFTVTARTARDAIEELLNTYFSTDSIIFSDEDVLQIDVLAVSDINDKNTDSCYASGEKDSDNDFVVYFDTRDKSN